MPFARSKSGMTNSISTFKAKFLPKQHKFLTLDKYILIALTNPNLNLNYMYIKLILICKYYIGN